MRTADMTNTELNTKLAEIQARVDKATPAFVPALKSFRHNSVKLYACPACGSDDLNLHDCGYSSFNCGGVRCRSCEHELKLDCLGCFPEKEIAVAWNKHVKTLAESAKNPQITLPVADLRLCLQTIAELREDIERLIPFTKHHVTCPAQFPAQLRETSVCYCGLHQAIDAARGKEKV